MQNLISFAHLKIFSIDSQSQNKQDKQFNFFSENLFHYQENLFHLKNICRQPVATSVEFVPLEWFSQAHYRGKLFVFWLNTVECKMKKGNC